MMRMTFFWTPDLGEFFFKGLEINTVAQLAGLCVVVAFFALFYEGIKVKFSIMNGLWYYFNLVVDQVFDSIPGLFGICSSKNGSWTNGRRFLCPKWIGQFINSGQQPTEKLYSTFLSAIQWDHGVLLPQFNWLCNYVKRYGLQRMAFYSCYPWNGLRILCVRSHYNESEHGKHSIADYEGCLLNIMPWGRYECWR